MSTQEKRFKVYKHTNKVNGKVYIGITSQKLNDRFKNGNGYFGTYFANAIKKYGWNNFTHEILIEGLTKDEAFEKERYFIEAYQSNNRNNGYNITSGGDGARDLPAEVLDRIRESNIKYSTLATLTDGSNDKIFFKNSNAFLELMGIHKGSRSHITEVINGTRDVFMGMKWERVELGDNRYVEYTLDAFLNKRNITIKELKKYLLNLSEKSRTPKVGVRIQPVIVSFKYNEKDYNLFFNSIQEFSKFINVGDDSIYTCLNGKRRSIFSIEVRKINKSDLEEEELIKMIELRDSISNNGIIKNEILDELKKIAKRNVALRNKNNKNSKARRPVCIYIKNEKILKIYTVQRELINDYKITHISDKSKQWRRYLSDDSKPYVIFYKEDLDEFNNCGITVKNTYNI